jgi:hypothetical protein
MNQLLFSVQMFYCEQRLIAEEKQQEKVPAEQTVRPSKQFLVKNASFRNDYLRSCWWPAINPARWLQLNI